MHKVNLASVDLNLLVALQALLDEQNVTRAAAKVGLSQPAMSRALGRLRDLFSDQLLVRTSKGMSPTPRGAALAEPLGKVLCHLCSYLGRFSRCPFSTLRFKRFVVCASTVLTSSADV